MSNIQSYPALLAVMNERRSCRSYDTNRIPEHDLIAAAIDAARIAPSACNRQPWQFLVVDSEEARQQIFEAYGKDWIKTAPTYIIAIGNHDESWHRPYDGKDHLDIDLAIAVEHLCLAAASLELSTCWVCNFDPAKLSQAFHIEAPQEPIAIIPIGYAAADAAMSPRPRKSSEEIIRWGNL